MIVVEIYVPYTDKKYEFRLNEDVAVSVVVDEICSVISEKEQRDILGKDKRMVLVHADRGVVLAGGKSLYESNIDTGDRLILV